MTRQIPFAVAALLAVAAPAEAQPIVVQAPAWQVGTTCTFHMDEEYVDGKHVNDHYDYTQQVESVSGRLVSLNFTSPRGSTMFTWTTDGNLVSYGSGTYAPFFPTYSFPLTPGKSWNAKFTLQAGTASIPYEATSKAVAWQNVTVQGKPYGAMKIEVKGRYFNHGAWGSFEQTVHYAPAVNRAVKEQRTLNSLAGSTWYQENKELIGCQSN